MNHCKHCNQLIDKYEEYDFVIIIIDLILHKSQVYRHLIFNRMDTYDAGIDPNLVKLAIILIFCDGYIKFSRVRALLSHENGKVYSEAKAVGYDVKIIRQIVRLRKMEADDRAEMEAILETYKKALGMDLL